MIEINKELCIGCGRCVEDCLLDNLKLLEEKAQVISPCIQCGHCVAVCPAGAVSIPDYDMEDVEEYREGDFSVKPENYLHAVKFRRSIRSYQEKAVEREKAERIINAGRYTATAANRQACRFIFVEEKLSEFKELMWKELPAVIEALRQREPRMAGRFLEFYEAHQKDSGEDSFLFGAPAVLVITASNVLDVGLAASNMENMAVAEGLGVLYSGYMVQVINSSRALKEWLELGEQGAVCVMVLGYPAVTYKRTAPRKKADILWK